MAETWDELWEEIEWDRVTTIPFITERIQEIRAMGDRLQAAITQINECIGEYESKEWCSHCLVDSKCAQITMAAQELKEKLKLAGIVAEEENEAEVYSREFLRQAEAFRALASIIRRREQPQTAKDLADVLVADGLADVCEGLAKMVKEKVE